MKIATPEHSASTSGDVFAQLYDLYKLERSFIGPWGTPAKERMKRLFRERANVYAAFDTAVLLAPTPEKVDA